MTDLNQSVCSACGFYVDTPNHNLGCEVGRRACSGCGREVGHAAACSVDKQPDALNPSDSELRKAWALILADALHWTGNPTQLQLALIREGVLRLVRDDHLTTHEEREFQRALLEAGCRLTGPFRAELWR